MNEIKTLNLNTMFEDNKYSIVSLFSGAGGFDWGFHRTGRFRTVVACELLCQPAATLARNLQMKIVKAPITPVLNGSPIVIEGDIREVNFSGLNFETDVLIGGPPCQDFSVVISKKGEERPGLNGGRGGLYVEFVRALMFLQPKMFVFENVPGLLSANEGAAIKTIQKDLQSLESKRYEALQQPKIGSVPNQPIQSYKIIFSQVVVATKLGIPQARNRLIIIGLREDLYRHFSNSEQKELGNQLKSKLDGDNSLLTSFPMTCLEIFEGKPLPELQEKYSKVMSSYRALAYAKDMPKSLEWRNQVWKKLHLHDIRQDYFIANKIETTPENLTNYEAAMGEHKKLLKELDWLNKPVHVQSYQDNTHIIKNLSKGVIDRMKMIPPDENHEFVIGTDWEVEGKGISFIYRRTAPLKPAYTVMAYGGGGTYGYHYDRSKAMLTLRERARIQTFTDDFIFEKDGIRAQIGEAVPPLMGQRIAENIYTILDTLREKGSFNVSN